MKTKALLTLAATGSLLSIAGCGAQDNDGPPEIRYGDSVCAHCGMIISDERFATSTIVESDRGDLPIIFDDFNCQVNYESAHPQLKVVARWSHDHDTSEWKPSEELWFIRSDKLNTPMASHVAAFTSEADARAFAEPIDAQVMPFPTLWREINP